MTAREIVAVLVALAVFAAGADGLGYSVTDALVDSRFRGAAVDGALFLGWLGVWMYAVDWYIQRREDIAAVAQRISNRRV